MIQNYEYFITLAETLNISKAAEKLFISHQCLSRYLKNLENECGVTLFNRKPALSLTYAGQILLDSFLEIQRSEKNALQAFTELKSGNSGEIHLGITEGKLRSFMPILIKEYQKQYPNVTLKATALSTSEMLTMLQNNRLDIVIGGITGTTLPGLDYHVIMEEHLYLIVSDNLMRKYFPDDYEERIAGYLKHGAALSDFADMPMAAAPKGFNTRTMIDEHLIENNISMNFVYEANQPDFLQILTANDCAASFCLSMYLPSIRTLNLAAPDDNQLNIFEIHDLDATNPVLMVTQKGKYFPTYTKAFIKLVKQKCRELYNPQVLRRL